MKRFLVVTLYRTDEAGVDHHIVIDTEAEEVLASCASKYQARRIAAALDVTPGEKEEPF